MLQDKSHKEEPTFDRIYTADRGTGKRVMGKTKTRRLHEKRRARRNTARKYSFLFFVASIYEQAV